MSNQKSSSKLKRKLDYALSMSYMKIFWYLCLTFIILFLIVIFLLWIAIKIDADNHISGVNIPGTAFLLLTDPGNVSGVFPHNDSWILGLVYALIAMGGAVLFGGTLISLISNSIQLRVDDFQNGNIHYQLDNHIVVIGYDPMVPSLVKQLQGKYQQKDILLLTKRNPQEVREELSTIIDIKSKHLLLYSGRRDSEIDLLHLQVEKAIEVYIIGNRENDNHDALNFACLSKLVEIVRNSGVKRKPFVNILLENKSTQTILQSSNLAEEWCKVVRVIPFNFYENWARQVLNANPVLVESNKEADKDLIAQNQASKVLRYPRILVKPESKEEINIVIFGMSRLGITLGIEAAHSLHFPKLPDGKIRKTTITFISKNAYDEMLLFRAHYRQIFEIQSSRFLDYTDSTDGKPKEEPFSPLYFTGDDADFLDISFEFVKGDAFSEDIHGFLEERVDNPNCLMQIFTCTGIDSIDMSIGLLLSEKVLRNSNVFIRQHHTGQLLTWLHDINEEQNGKYSRVYPFGMANSKFDINHESQEMGILINYYYWYRDSGAVTFNKDHLLTAEECQAALDTWTVETSIANQWSSSYCCLSFAQKLALWGIDSLDEAQENEITDIITNNIDSMAYIEHNRWNMEKLLLGYRKPHYDEQKMINECRKTISDKTKDKEEKKKCLFMLYKNKHLVHDYIRPFDELATVTWKGKDDNLDDIRKIDNNMLEQIPWIIKNRKKIQEVL